MTILGVSRVCSAFEDKTVGSKVVGKGELLLAVHEKIEQTSEEESIHVLSLGEDLFYTVLAGESFREGIEAKDMTIVEHRGEFILAVDRRAAKSVPLKSLSVLVYNIDLYLQDPQVQAGKHGEYKDELEVFKKDGVSHVIVAVLASAFDSAPVSSHRFVRNLAGGNPEYAMYDAPTLTEMCQGIVEYEGKVIVVADRG